MKDTLSKIMIGFKVAKIIAKINFIVSVVAGAIVILAYPMALIGGGAPDGFLHECIYEAIGCAGSAVIAMWGVKFFDSVLRQKTPFAHESVKGCFRFGLVAAITPLATVALSSAVTMVFAFTDHSSLEVLRELTEPSASPYFFVGLIALLMTPVLRHGTELRQAVEQAAEKQEQSANE